jgi:hypothetical protein
VPTLLVNGDHDLSTPLEWAREELRLTTNGRLVVVPGAGHSTQSRASTGVARTAVARFLLGDAIVLHVRATPTRSSSGRCAFVVVARVAEGGRQTTCLTSVDGFPGPGAVIRSRGTMTFSLRGGAIRARVSVVQRFRADGVHAHQTLTGTVTGGTGRYARARGTITGGGAVLDRRDGLGPASLTYRLTLR